MSDEDLSLDQAMAAQKRLRAELGLPDERFPLPAFIGMISDEIEQMRAAGKPDAETARLLRDATGVDVTADAIGRFYASAEARRRG